MVPGLGANGTGRFQLSVGWRYAQADKSYRNSRLNHDFTRLWRPAAQLSVMDVSGRYQINKRTGVLVSLPVVFNRFSMLYPPLGATRGARYDGNARGIGDLSIFGQTLLLDPASHPYHNIGIGYGIKVPTGNWNSKDFLPDQTGNNFAQRSVYPPAIQPGDGGVGILLGLEGYRLLRNYLPIIHGGTIFASGNYLINARDTNGTPSMVQSLGVPLNPFFATRLTNSVADSYNARIGIALRVPRTWDKPNLKGLRLRIVGGCEGLNSRDLIGKNIGFRQPGYSLTVGPGLTYARGKDILTVDVPFVFNRHINPNQSLLPGLPVNRPGGPTAAPVGFNRQMGLVAPLSVAVRYVRIF